VLMFDEEWMAKKMCDWTQGTWSNSHKPGRPWQDLFVQILLCVPVSLEIRSLLSRGCRPVTPLGPASEEVREIFYAFWLAVEEKVISEIHDFCGGSDSWKKKKEKVRGRCIWFSLLWQNTWEKQLKGRKMYFGSLSGVSGHGCLVRLPRAWGEAEPT
jgi:hypothetical protein